MFFKQFELEAWSGAREMTEPLDTKRLKFTLTQEHVDRAYWRQFRDPVSECLNEALDEHPAVQVFWNSDGWFPRYPDDDAYVGMSVETLDGELSIWQPLPRSAERAMKHLALRGKCDVPVTFQLDVPTICMRSEKAGG